MSVKSGNKILPTTSLRRFPYPSVTYDMFLDNFAVHVFPFFVVLAFYYTTKTIIRVSLIINELVVYFVEYLISRQNVAMERESQMKETMKIMGLTSCLYWLAWFAKCLLMLSLPLAFMVLFLTVRASVD